MLDSGEGIILLVGIFAGAGIVGCAGAGFAAVVGAGAGAWRISNFTFSSTEMMVRWIRSTISSNIS
jgi:hypothetical protein